MFQQTRVVLAITILLCMLSQFGGVACNDSPNASSSNSHSTLTADPPSTVDALVPTAVPVLEASIGRQLKIITNEVLGIRGLDLLDPLDSNFMSREELRDFLLESFREEYPLETATTDEEILELMGLISEDLNLFDLYVDLYSEEVAGLYDDETKKIYMVIDGDPVNYANDPVLAHEIVHALQDQRFDLTAMTDIEDDSDRLRAVVALVEGDATLVQSIYFNQFLTRAEQNQLQLDAQVSWTFLNAPMFIQETLLFPYQFGSLFVKALFDRGGWDLVNQALMNPPQSTTEILHPELYLNGDELPQTVQFPELASLMGPTWKLEMEDTVGEFFLRLHLAVELHALEAGNAAEGWVGDRLMYLKDADGEYCLAIKIMWRNSEEGEEFLRTYLDYLQERGITDEDLIHVEGTARYWRNHPDGVVYLGREGDQVLLMWGSTTSILRRVARFVW